MPIFTILSKKSFQRASVISPMPRFSVSPESTTPCSFNSAIEKAIWSSDLSGFSVLILWFDDKMFDKITAPSSSITWCSCHSGHKRNQFPGTELEQQSGHHTRQAM